MTGDSMGVIARKPSDLPDEIPEAWSDPKEALPHVVRQMRMWFLTMKSIDAEVGEVARQLCVESLSRESTEALYVKTCRLRARSEELNHEVGNRLTEWALVVDELRRQAVVR